VELYIPIPVTNGTRNSA